MSFKEPDKIGRRRQLDPGLANFSTLLVNWVKEIYYKMLYTNYKRCIMHEDEATTIQLKKSTINELKRIKRYPRETYNETISNLIKIAKESKTKRQYDEFLHKIQQAKMKELWDNSEDEAWEHA